MRVVSWILGLVVLGGGAPGASGQCPLNTISKLVPYDAVAGDRVGEHVVVSGDTLALNAGGGVLLYERAANGWDFGSPVWIDAQSSAVSIDLEGDTLVVMGDAKIEVFERDHPAADLWGETAQLDSGAFVPGREIALSGDTFAVGNDGGDGVVNVYQRNPAQPQQWLFVTSVANPFAGTLERFGESLDLQGDTLVAAAFREEDAIPDKGAVAVFERDQGGADAWGLVTSFQAPTPQFGDFFGYDLSLDGDELLVGAPAIDLGAPFLGRAHRHRRDEGGADAWGWVDTIEQPAGSGPDRGFGRRLQLRDGWAVIVDEDGAWVYEDDGGWVERTQLIAATIGRPKGVAFDGELVWTGRPDDTGERGAVFGFRRDGTPPAPAAVTDVVAAQLPVVAGQRPVFEGDRAFITSATGGVGVRVYEEDPVLGWQLQSTIAPPPGSTQFGGPVAASGDRVVVGAQLEAYVFEWDGTAWVQMGAAVTSAADPVNQGQGFPNDVVLDGDELLLADSGEIVAGVSDGSVTEYTWDGSAWAVTDRLFAPTDIGLFTFVKQFGFRLAVEGDWLAVTHLLAQLGEYQSIVHLYRREAGAWVWHEWIGPADPTMNSGFGISLDMSGGRLALGDSNYPEQGAVYLFVLHEGSWVQEQRLCMSSGAPSLFGQRLDLEGDVLSVEGDSLQAGVILDRMGSVWVERPTAYPTDAFLPLLPGGVGVALPGVGTTDIVRFEPLAWSDVGSALPGAAGDPLLVGTGSLEVGSANEVALGNAAPSAFAGLFLAVESNPVPFKGGTLLPVPYLPPKFATSSASGEIAIPFVMPAGSPPGTELWVQWAIQDAGAVAGVALSNGVMGVVP